eukprot:TRINITY_DN6632_c0_g1_i1.p1 TRINITY_DN6632_c0_g1~~TRINITY_DN6632_c0_g1_i1.p1  ORF type:complete len:381 (+),score=4.97 TRINITY_DN6632_c0_g1_i1:333-1475(+)
MLGYRFVPTDEELVAHYLMRKHQSDALIPHDLAVVDVLDIEPWELPEAACMDEGQWYFYVSRTRGPGRTCRSTRRGFYKPTGRDTEVFCPKKNRIIGLKKKLVYYFKNVSRGSAAARRGLRGGKEKSAAEYIRTDWVMHEYRLLFDGEGGEQEESEASPRDQKPQQHAATAEVHAPETAPPVQYWVLCHVFSKGPMFEPREEDDMQVDVRRSSKESHGHGISFSESGLTDHQEGDRKRRRCEAVMDSRPNERISADRDGSFLSLGPPTSGLGKPYCSSVPTGKSVERFEVGKDSGAALIISPDSSEVVNEEFPGVNDSPRSPSEMSVLESSEQACILQEGTGADRGEIGDFMAVRDLEGNVEGPSQKRHEHEGNMTIMVF